MLCWFSDQWRVQGARQQVAQPPLALSLFARIKIKILHILAQHSVQHFTFLKNCILPTVLPTQIQIKYNNFKHVNINSMIQLL